MKSPRTDLVAKQLFAAFHRNGYIRRQNSRRRTADGYRNYKKGDEIRFVAKSRSELAKLRRLLRRADFRPGQPFAKKRQFAQPVYGRTAVRRLMSLLRAARKHEPHPE